MPDFNDLSNLQFPPGTADAERSVPAAKVHDWLRQNKQPIRIRGARITGLADLSGLNFAHELLIHNSHFEGPLDLRESRFGKSVDLRGSTFAGGIGLSGLRVTGSLLLTEAKIHKPTEGAPFADCSLMRIEGNFLADGLVSQVRVGFSGIRVAGNVDLSRADVSGGLDLEVGHIEGSFHANRLTVHHSTAPGDEKAGTSADGEVLMGGIQVAGQVSFSGAQIAGDLNLYSSNVACGLRCASARDRQTIIGGDALLGSAKISFGADFSGTRIDGNFNLEDAYVEGELTALTMAMPPSSDDPEKKPDRVRNLDGWRRTEVHGAAVFGGLKVTGAARFNSIYVKRSLDLTTTELKGGLFCIAFRDLGAEIGGPVLLSAARIQVTADFSEAKITGGLHLQNAVIDGDLFCHRTEVLNDPHAEDQMGHLSFGGLKVSGQVSINGARVAADVNLQSAEIKGGLYGRPHRHRTPRDGDAPGGSSPQLGSEPVRADLSAQVRRSQGAPEGPCLHVGRSVYLSAATISGGVHFDAVQISRHLNLESVHIEGGLFLTPSDVPGPGTGKDPHDRALVTVAARIQGSVTLDAARVSGEVLCGGVTVSNDFSLKSAELRNGLSFKPIDGLRGTVNGSIRLGAAKVSGEVHFGGCLIGEELDLEGTVIDGKLFAQSEQHRTEIRGKATLDGVKVSGPVNLNGADVKGELTLRGAVVQGLLTCAHAAVASRLDLSHAKVAGEVALDATTIGKELSLQGAAIEGHLNCRRTHVGERVDLSSCSVRSAVLDFSGLEDPRAEARGKRTWPLFRLENFQFQELSLGGNEKARDYLDLLEASEKFDVSTYVAMERWLRNQGKDEQANKVYLAMRASSRKWGKMNPISYVIDLLFTPAIRLAMRFRELLGAFVVSVFVATLLFLNPASVDLRDKTGNPPTPSGTPLPHDPTQVLDKRQKWNLYEAFGMAVQIHVPMAHFDLADKWQPSRESITVLGVDCWVPYVYYASAIELLGYIAVPLFLGGLFNSWLRSKVRND